jgi:PAS domain S-box-containing protein
MGEDLKGRLETVTAERDRLAAELEAQRRFTDGVLGTAPDLIYVVDLATHANIYANRELVDILGYTPDAIQALGADLFVTIFHPDDLGPALAHHDAMRDAADGEVRELTYRCKTSTGEWHWLRSRDVPFKRGDDGRVTQIIGVASDVTGLRTAQTELQAHRDDLEGMIRTRTAALVESEQRFQRVLEASNTGIWDWNIEDDTVYFSPRWKGLLGFEDDALQNEFDTWVTLLHPDDKDRMLGAVQAFVANPNGHFVHEFRMRHRDGSYRWILNRSAAELKDGRPVRMAGSHLDITERRRSEEDLERAYDRLTRTNAELERLVYVASHDLRSPLVNIQGFSREVELSLEELRGLLEAGSACDTARARAREILGQDVAEAMGFIRSSVSKMDALMSGLLKLSRTARGAPDMQTVETDVLVDEVLRDFEFRIQEIGVSVEREALPRCFGDPAQLSQVLSNLVDNALKYLSSDRPGRVRISGARIRDRVQIVVEDNGIGIAPADRARVFDVFQRVNPAATDGEGLGLSIVRKIIDGLGGEIWVDGGGDEAGSRFILDLKAV